MYKREIQVAFTITVSDIYIPVVYFEKAQFYKKCECDVWCICHYGS